MNDRFIVIEGPNGVGKTASAAMLAKRLRDRGYRVHSTCEPSNTPLGRLVRFGEHGLIGRALALAVAADRCVHVTDEIIPALHEGQVVISDRYVPSSLVLQRLDGLDLAEVWSYNRWALQPMLTFYLDHDAAIIEKRLDERRQRSRLEQAASPARERQLYEEAYAFLAGEGWHQAGVNCIGRNVDQVVTIMLAHLNLEE
ncbi:dTMP kinase [Nonomuraea sp. NPDC055795]